MLTYVPSARSILGAASRTIRADPLTPSIADRRGERTVRWLLIALLVASAGLRIPLAARGLDSGRNFDERFSFFNITRILQDGTLEPRQANYLSLSYLPQTAVLAAAEGAHRATGIEALSIYGPTADGYSPTAYLLCRLCVVAYSVAAVWLTFLIGRRLFDPMVGLLAAALLAAFGRHLISAAQFKPDSLVVLATAVAFWASLRLASDRRLARFLLIGVAIGGAVSAKATGISAAIPVTVAALWLGARDLRLWARLAAAAGAAIVTFAALNPWLVKVFFRTVHVLRGYGAKAAHEGSGHWTVVTDQVEFLFAHHGWAVFAFVAAGFAGMVRRALRRDVGRAERLGPVLLVSQVVGYSTLHAAVMTLFRGQNYLSVAPFTSLLAAWAMAESGRFLARRFPRLATPRAATAVWAAVALTLVLRPALYVYRQVVPSTYERAWSLLTASLEPVALRQVSYEVGGGPGRALVAGRERGVALRATLTPEHEPTLRLSDAELFPGRRVRALEDFALGRVAEVPGDWVRVVRSRPFAIQGEEVVVLLHPWRPDSSLWRHELALRAEGRRLVATLPAAAPGDVLLFELLVPRRGPRTGSCTLAPGGPALPLLYGGQRAGRRRLLTPRIELPAGVERVAVEFAAPPAVEACALRVHRLSAPSARRAAAAAPSP